MAKYALYVSLKAKPGKTAEVEAFLKQGAGGDRNRDLVWHQRRRWVLCSVRHFRR
jgi:hypothetical protein